MDVRSVNIHQVFPFFNKDNPSKISTSTDPYRLIFSRCINCNSLRFEDFNKYDSNQDPFFCDQCLIKIGDSFLVKKLKQSTVYQLYLLMSQGNVGR